MCKRERERERERESHNLGAMSYHSKAVFLQKLRESFFKGLAWIKKDFEIASKFSRISLFETVARNRTASIGRTSRRDLISVVCSFSLDLCPLI